MSKAARLIFVTLFTIGTTSALIGFYTFLIGSSAGIAMVMLGMMCILFMVLVYSG